MPSKTVKQQHFMGMVHALQKGKIQTADLPPGVREKVKKVAKSISPKASGEFAKNVEEMINFPALTFKQYMVVEAELFEAFCELADYEIANLVEKMCMQDEETSKAAKITKDAAKRGDKDVRVRSSEEDEEPAKSKEIMKKAVVRGGKDVRMYGK